MEKLMTQNALKMFRFVRIALMAGVGFPLILASNAFAQLPAPAVPAEPGAPPPSPAGVERFSVYGSDAISGVVNFFLVHKFRGLEIGATYGNTNLGASNEMGEWEAWIKAGTGDDKTDIVVIADFWERLGGVFSRDRDISSNGFFVPFGGLDARSGNFPGRVQSRRLLPSLFFAPVGTPQIGVNTPLPHSAPNAATSPFYKFPGVAFGTPAANNMPPVLGPFPDTKGGGDFFFFNFAAFTPALPPGDRQVYYGSFTRDICDKYLTVFGDFKYARSYFDSSLAAVPFTPDPFHNGLTGTFFSPSV